MAWHNIRSVQKVNERELELGVASGGGGSWYAYSRFHDYLRLAFR